MLLGRVDGRKKGVRNAWMTHGIDVCKRASPSALREELLELAPLLGGQRQRRRGGAFVLERRGAHITLVIVVAAGSRLRLNGARESNARRRRSIGPAAAHLRRRRLCSRCEPVTVASAKAPLAASASGPSEAADACAASVRRLRLSVHRQPSGAVRAKLPLHLAPYRVHQRRRARMRQVLSAQAEPARRSRERGSLCTRRSACAVRALRAAAARRAQAGRPSPAWRHTPRRRPPAQVARSEQQRAPARSAQPPALRRFLPRAAALTCASAARRVRTGSGDAALWRSA